MTIPLTIPLALPTAYRDRLAFMHAIYAQTTYRIAAVVWFKGGTSVVLGPFPTVSHAKKARHAWIYHEDQKPTRDLIDYDIERYAADVNRFTHLTDINGSGRPSHRAAVED